MKSLPALIALAALAAFVLLAVVSSVITSVPFMLIAAHIVSGACSFGLIGLFLDDYTPRAPQIDLSWKRVYQRRFQPSQREAHGVAAETPGSVWSTLGMRNDPATLSCS